MIPWKLEERVGLVPRDGRSTLAFAVGSGLGGLAELYLPARRRR